MSNGVPAAAAAAASSVSESAVIDPRVRLNEKGNSARDKGKHKKVRATRSAQQTAQV